MAEASTNLKAWMRKNDIYDNDLFEILTSQGVENPAEDFKTYTQSQWDVLWRKGCVERAKELKDQKAKVRLEKKMTKIEKHWRKESGIKSTSVKGKKHKKSDAKPLQNSAAAQNDALAQGGNLKKYLQKNQCYSNDLMLICVNMGITSEDDLEKIDSNASFDEIYRQVRVERSKDLKDNAARIRMEKQMTKFEKLWRAKTGVKKTSVKKKSKGAKKKDPTTQRNEDMAKGGADLKKWMRKNDVWEMALYDELMQKDISDPEQLKELDEDTFDKIVRKVRVDRFSQLKDAKARQRADKLLIKFEKIWRKSSGIKKTSLNK